MGQKVIPHAILSVPKKMIFAGGHSADSWVQSTKSFRHSVTTFKKSIILIL